MKMSDATSVPRASYDPQRIKLRFCSCFSVSTGIKILSIIALSIWVVFTFDTFIESNLLLFSLACVGCLYNLALCGYVSITTSKLTSYFMKHPLLVIILSNLDVLVSVVLVVVAHTSRPEWENGGVVTHSRVSNM